MTLPSFLRLKGDPVIWVIFFALCIISLVEVFSATSMLSYHSGSYLSPFIRQAAILGVGIIISISLHNVPCQLFKYISGAWPFIVLLLLITAFTGGEVNGAARWFQIGGLSFQPSEFAKGILIATVAMALSRSREGKNVNNQGIKYVLFFTLPIVLLIFKENISTAVFLFGVIYVMMFVASVPRKQMFMLTAVCVGLVLAGVAALKVFPSSQDDNFYKTPVGAMFKRVPTAQQRIFGKSLVITENPDSLEVTDKNMQVVHGLIAVSNNNHGLGRMPGNSVERDYLPQAYSDFIFAIIVEETGIWGTCIIVLLYLVLLFRIGVMANKCGQNFAAFLVMGLGILLVGQAFLNMLVALGVGPVTGQTLPLVSRGGTATLITCAYFGIIQSVAWSGVKKTSEKAIESPEEKPAKKSAPKPVAEPAAELTAEEPTNEVPAEVPAAEVAAEAPMVSDADDDFVIEVPAAEPAEEPRADDVANDSSANK